MGIRLLILYAELSLYHTLLRREAAHTAREYKPMKHKACKYYINILTSEIIKSQNVFSIGDL